VALVAEPDAACLGDEGFSVVVMMLRSVMVKPP
jgi:hypothetical protein